MRDYSFQFRKNLAPVTMQLLYMDSARVWEVYFEVPIEYQVKYNNVLQAPYDTYIAEGDNVYHDEKWNVDLGELWNWVLENHGNVAYQGYGSGEFEYTQTEYEFFLESDNGYHSILEWVVLWFNNSFSIVK
jgi:hypothetical protein